MYQHTYVQLHSKLQLPLCFLHPQVFHICQEGGQQDSFLCPNGTVFNQQYFVCDIWNNVDCSKSRQYYSLNAEIGKVQEKHGQGVNIDGFASSSTLRRVSAAQSNINTQGVSGSGFGGFGGSNVGGFRAGDGVPGGQVSGTRGFGSQISGVGGIAGQTPAFAGFPGRNPGTGGFATQNLGNFGIPGQVSGPGVRSGALNPTGSGVQTLGGGLYINQIPSLGGVTGGQNHFFTRPSQGGSPAAAFGSGNLGGLGGITGGQQVVGAGTHSLFNVQPPPPQLGRLYFTPNN